MNHVRVCVFTTLIPIICNIVPQTLGTLLLDEGAISSYLGTTKGDVCVYVCDRYSDQAF